MFYEYNSKPIQGYKLQVNKKTGEQFPNCYENHQKIVSELDEWFEDFPNCCEGHSKLATTGAIKKEQYIGVVAKIIRQVSYTQDCIARKLENNDWFDDITEYIEYNIDSFGYHKVGADKYSHYLKIWLENAACNDSEKLKLQRINKFIESYGKVNESNTDLHLLYSTYQTWLKLFPFEITLFADLKPRFESQFEMMEGGILALNPQLLLSGGVKTNRYSNIAKANIHSESSFVGVLLSLTKYLLNSLNITELRKRGEITDLTATQLEFCEASLKTKTERITKDYTKGELEYLSTLEEWLGVHKEYFNEITKLLTTSSPITKQKPEQENPKTFEELFHNTDLVIPCIDILKKLDPPLIDTDYNFIGKLKGVVCVWIDEMQRQGIVKSNYLEERKLFASLIPQKIKRFSIDESMFGKHQSKAEKLYRIDIKKQVSSIKLSQNSH